MVLRGVRGISLEQSRSRLVDEVGDGFLCQYPWSCSGRVIHSWPRTIQRRRMERHPVIRGTGYRTFDRMGYLWTKGFVPRLRTYTGWEVPNPLCIQIDQGEADL